MTESRARRDNYNGCLTLSAQHGGHPADAQSHEPRRAEGACCAHARGAEGAGAEIALVAPEAEGARLPQLARPASEENRACVAPRGSGGQASRPVRAVLRIMNGNGVTPPGRRTA